MLRRFPMQAGWFCFVLALVVPGMSPLLLHAEVPNNPSAAVILHRAKAQARAQHKSIMVEFDASWCVNCKLYDGMLADPAMHAILSKAFVFTTLDTGEKPRDTRHADTPGGVAFEDSVGGKGAGWPFLVVLNANGRPIINSYRPDRKSATGKDNIGYPVLPQEIDWFMTMVRRGAPQLSHADLVQLRAWLTVRAAKIQQE